jgi:hypothetical protein
MPMLMWRTGFGIDVRSRRQCASDITERDGLLRFLQAAPKFLDYSDRVRNHARQSSVVVALRGVEIGGCNRLDVIGFGRLEQCVHGFWPIENRT